MRQTWAICKAELSQLFFSPIAWLIIVIFSFQTYQTFTAELASIANDMDLHGAADNVTYTIFSHYSGIFRNMMSNLYMFIPLLTMGLMSRDMNNGAIKLLYSSPVTSTQIVVGKFLSMVIFSFFMLGITIPAIWFTGAHVEHTDYGLIFSGLGGEFLLFWAYSAIGLFMSCLTSYQIVAALLTLGTLGFLNYLGNVGQEIDFVRDITYWASLSGRTEQLTAGLVSSEDILYFLMVILLFLLYSIFLLQYKKNPRKWLCAAKYVGATVVMLTVGYITSRPAFTLYHDATQIESNTLTQNSIDVVKKLEGKLDITTYANLSDYESWCAAPVTINDDIKRYKTYLRFKPDIRMKTVYYYDEPLHNYDHGTPDALDMKETAVKYAEGFGIPWRKVLTPEQIHERIDLRGELNYVVKQLTTEDGRKTWLRVFDDMVKYPDEQEITTALYRLENGAVDVAFLTGHNERSITRAEDADYNGFSSALNTRNALVNTGFDVKQTSADTTLRTDILVIADARKALTEDEEARIFEYLDKGGNMVLAFEPRRAGIVSGILAYLGVGVLDGTMVYPGSETSPSVIPAVTTDYASIVSGYFFPGMRVSMPTAAAIDYRLDSEWDAVPVLAAPGTECWNETETTDFSSISGASDLSANLAAGEFKKAHSLALALSRKVNGKEQRVMVIGDADCLSNVEMNTPRKSFRAMNSIFCTGVFNWMSDNKLPVDVNRQGPIDNSMKITPDSAYKWTIVLKWVFQAVLALIGVLVIMRRQRR